MSTNPPPAKMMLVNCIVNQTFNFVPPPNMNPPVMRVMMCSRCHVIQPLRPQDAKSITCDVCKFITFLYPDPHSRVPWLHCPKRAVICGISYRNSSPGLKGSIDDAQNMKNLLDAKNMKNLLVKRFGFPESAIFMLTDKETDPWKTPTKNNLLWALNWLGQGCQPKDSLVFHYSGHGLRLRNYRLREVDDGYNETLCPMDFETQGMIFDDEINRAIVERLPPEVKLHAIIDSCHRNSVLELSFLYKKNRSGQYEWEDHRPRSGVFKGTSGGDAISFSGSVEVPPSADDAFSPKTTSKVSMTSCFIDAIKAIKDEHKRTYWSILDSMEKTMDKTDETRGNLKQEPLLSACGQFDVNSKLFTL